MYTPGVLQLDHYNEGTDDRISRASAQKCIRMYVLGLSSYSSMTLEFARGGSTAKLTSSENLLKFRFCSNTPELGQCPTLDRALLMQFRITVASFW